MTRSCQREEAAAVTYCVRLEGDGAVLAVVTGLHVGEVVDCRGAEHEEVQRMVLVGERRGGRCASCGARRLRVYRAAGNRWSGPWCAECWLVVAGAMLEEVLARVGRVEVRVWP